ncbi:MerR family transcriptional regulator [Nocardia sp. CDC186]|uniref:MerR family transcriptional regulator n=1 Tax=Nocardia implantans TaxID=3108168 RepID=A0ABU6ATP0_9NOCA|nr:MULTISPECIES: MerR family transcriptional regulator [unclassified Nocardia]MBF6191191.1 MerR family transcriptional regulator [Nocardia beijingensis]MEA3529190.1 MerR family transcriptional regulator [Nocardia sp. CDC192]MEB3510855.1 MerR family transcriptional regulator [Nocardia sp. CDC186]
MGLESAQLITIGVLARASGLTASALRFYDDCGLLVPARVDPLTGYRYYTEAQRERAVLIRQLRAIDLPLDAIAEILAGDSERARRLLDRHVAELAHRAEEAARVAAVVKQALGTHVAVDAAALAEALDQVRTAAARTREIPVLAGVLLEASANTVTLTATDRYRLSTRTVVANRQHGGDWSAVLDSSGLESITEQLRGMHEVVVAPSDDGLLLMGDGAQHHSPVIDGPFPDHRALLAGLGPVRTRVVVARHSMLNVLESSYGTMQFAIHPNEIAVSGLGEAHCLPAQVTGSAVTLSFDPATLLPAVHTALGPDLMLDVIAADQPVVLRSATDGDLTTLAMPVRPLRENASG